MKHKFSKKLLSLLLVTVLVISSAVIALAEDNEVTLNPEAYPKFADKSYGALYAHATLGGDSANAWQRWDNGYSGINAKEGVRYFFLPKTADDSKVEIYNNYETDIKVGEVNIPSYTSAVVDYESGKQITVTSPTKTYTLEVYKSDSESSVYVNDTTNSYTDAEGTVQNTDLYSFLIMNKENSVKGSDCAVTGESGVSDTTLKKIKGRGNTNWRDTDKKPFNIQFNDTITIGHTTNKKFSLVSNAKDSTLIRNSIMYDLANEVGSPYSPSQSFVDFFVNGVYRGCYIACQKIELGKNSVVSLKDESDKKDTGFNFLVEVDVWNYASDVYFVSDKGYHVVLKTPDLEGYDETDATMNTQYNFIKNKYQEFENALYGGNLADLEKICDIESLATQYLLQDFGKNCDGGYTSTYFTYNADEDKFYAAPIWDCDSDLGAVDCMRESCTESTCNYKGWVTRNATYTYNKKIKTVNPLGQAFKLSGATESGKNFEQLCADIWNEKFVPNINIILGKAPASGSLKSIDDYASSISSASYLNYVMWDFMWLCSRYNAGLNKRYTDDYSGELSYLKDWTQARADWMTAQFKPSTPTEPDTPSDSYTIYFANTKNWNNVSYYAWTNRTPKADWPGEPAQYVGKNADGVDIYKAVFPKTYANVIFNDGGIYSQTDDIAITADSAIYYPAQKASENSYKEIFSFTSDSYGNDAVIGDVNADGNINVKDTTLIQKYLVNDAALNNTQIKIADTNFDNTVSIRDATIIQMYTAKIINSFK